MLLKVSMYHYVYYSYEEWGRGYIGARSCDCLPEQDVGYLGSYSDKSFQPNSKIILMTFPTREEANQAEIMLHWSYDVARNPNFANKANACAVGFAVPGPFEEDHRLKIKAAKIEYWLNKETREKHLKQTKEWWETRPEKFNQRTEAMKKGREAWAQKNPELLLEIVTKASEAARLRALKNPQEAKARAHKAAQERNKKLTSDPEFDRLRLSKVSKPVVLTLPTGEEIEFESKFMCAQYLGVSLTPIVNKLSGKNPYKLRGYSLRLRG